MTKTQKYILAGTAAVVVIASTAVAATMITRASMEPEVKPVARAHVPAQPMQQTASAQPVQAQQPPCDDHNIVGTLGGAVAGGLIGNQFGKGSGRTIATVGGVAGGAYLGNEYIPTRGATCR